jgi:glycerol uptake facilitator-like aquaporin
MKLNNKFSKLKLRFNFVNYKIVREFLAEFIGTLVLVAIGCGGIATVVLKPKPDKNLDALFISFGWGFGVFMGLILSSNITGHINPAITLSMFLLRKINFIQMLVFMMAQYIGAFFGASIVYFVYLIALNNFDYGLRQVRGSQASVHIFATFPNKNIHPISGLIDQIVATSLLTLCVIAITDRRLNKNAHIIFNPLFIGLLVSLLLLTFGFNCG